MDGSNFQNFVQGTHPHYLFRKEKSTRNGVLTIFLGPPLYRATNINSNRKRLHHHGSLYIHLETSSSDRQLQGCCQCTPFRKVSCGRSDPLSCLRMLDFRRHGLWCSMSNILEQVLSIRVSNISRIIEYLKFPLRHKPFSNSPLVGSTTQPMRPKSSSNTAER